MGVRSWRPHRSTADAAEPELIAPDTSATSDLLNVSLNRSQVKSFTGASSASGGNQSPRSVGNESSRLRLEDAIPFDYLAEARRSVLERTREAEEAVKGSSQQQRPGSVSARSITTPRSLSRSTVVATTTPRASSRLPGDGLSSSSAFVQANRKLEHSMYDPTASARSGRESVLSAFTKEDAYQEADNDFGLSIRGESVTKFHIETIDVMVDSETKETEAKLSRSLSRCTTKTPAESCRIVSASSIKMDTTSPYPAPKEQHAAKQQDTPTSGVRGGFRVGSGRSGGTGFLGIAARSKTVGEQPMSTIQTVDEFRNDDVEPELAGLVEEDEREDVRVGTSAATLVDEDRASKMIKVDGDDMSRPLEAEEARLAEMERDCQKDIEDLHEQLTSACRESIVAAGGAPVDMEELTADPVAALTASVTAMQMSQLLNTRALCESSLMDDFEAMEAALCDEEHEAGQASIDEVAQLP